MTVPVILTLHDDETTVGFASRLAATNGYASLDEFLMCIGTNRRLLTWGDADSVEALAYWSGENADKLSRFCLPKKNHSGRWWLGSAYLDEETHTGKTVRYCPCCICDDWSNRAGRKLARPYERAIWLTRLVSVCPVHQVPIMETEVDSCAPDFARFVESSEASIRKLAAAAVPHPVPPLSKYVAARIMGNHDNEFLDQNPCYIVVSLSEHLGAAMEKHPESPAVFPCDQKLAAADKGYLLASNGPKAIEQYFYSVAACSSHYRTQASSLFARCLMWLRRHLDTPDHEPIARIFHDIGSNCLVLAEGSTVVFPLEKRVLYSATLAARAYGMTGDRVVRLVNAAGIAMSTGQYSGDCIFKAEEADPILRKAAQMLRISEIAKILSVSHTTVNGLVEHGIIQAQEERTTESRKIARFCPDDIADFQRRLFEGTELTEDDTLITLGQAARRMSGSFELVVKLVLDGKIKHRARSDDSLTLNSLLVDWEEIRHHRVTTFQPVHAATNGTLIGYHEAQKLIGANYGSVKELVAHGFLKIGKITTHANGTRKGIKAASVERFIKEFVPLSSVAESRSMGPIAMRKLLESKGVLPIFEPGKARTRYYSRGDIETALSD